MRARSWMAALALIGATSILLIGRGLSAQAPGSTQESGPAKEAKGSPSQEKTAARIRRGRVEIRIAAREAQGVGVAIPRDPAQPRHRRPGDRGL